MKKAAILAVFVISFFLASGCIKQQNIPPENGFLEGKISIGPLCPVERIPPDPACQPTQETYKAWPIAVWRADENKATDLQPNLDGIYKIELPPGNYTVGLVAPQHFGANNLPSSVTIISGKITTLDIDIDTGIR